MTNEEYIEDVLKTESNDFKEIVQRFNPKMIRLLHGVMGISTEGGELLDQIKKHIFYGKKLDEINIKEEIGDLFWYCAIVCNTLNVSFEKIMEKNIKKLKARYGDKFNEEGAINRDLTKERKILED